MNEILRVSRPAAVALLALTTLNFEPVSATASEIEEIWLASSHAIRDIQEITKPNVAVGLPSENAKEYIAHYLSIESFPLLLGTAAADVKLDKQTLFATSSYRLTVAGSQTGFPIDILITGSVTFNVSITFSGYDFKFFPRIMDLSVDGVFEAGSHTSYTLPGPINGKLPEWLHDALLENLRSRGLLQLPVILSNRVMLSTDAFGGAPTIEFKQSEFTAEYWVEGAATLIDQAGIAGIAQLKLEATLPRCSDGPGIKNMRFAAPTVADRILQIPPNLRTISLRGESIGSPALDLTLAFRLNGVTVSQHPIAPNADLTFEVPLALVPGATGVYSAQILWQPDSQYVEPCFVTSASITKPRGVVLEIPASLSSADAYNKFDDFYELFMNKVQAGDLPLPREKTHLTFAKASLAGTLTSVFSSAGVGGLIDAATFPPEPVEAAKIRSPDPNAITCNSERVCNSMRVCTLRTCSYSRDRRSCKRKVLGVKINDPICEAAKALENSRRELKYGVCQTRAALAKFDCERLKSTENLICEAEKIAEEDLCNILVKAPVTAIEALIFPAEKTAAIVNGDFALAGEVDFSIPELKVAPAFDSFELELMLGADISANGTIEFVPTNIGGHIIGCLSKWKESTKMRALIPTEQRTISGAIEVDLAKNQGRLEVVIPEIEFELDPPPFEALFGEHPHLVTVCPFVAAAGVVDGLYALLKPEYVSTIWTGQAETDSLTVGYNIDLPVLKLSPGLPFPALILTMSDQQTAFLWTD